MTQVIRRLDFNESSYEAFAEWRSANGTRATKTVLLLILFVASASVPQAAHGAPSPQARMKPGAIVLTAVLLCGLLTGCDLFVPTEVDRGAALVENL